MTAVLFGLGSGIFFGAQTVVVRLGLTRNRDTESGALVLVGAAVIIAAAIAALLGDARDLASLWPFLLVGAYVPGVAQLMAVRAVREVGPSRASLLIGTAPLLSATLAIVILDERPTASDVLGIGLIVTGGALLAWERSRPEDFRAVGAALALGCAALFATRDNIVRSISLHDDFPSLAAAAATLLGGALFLIVYLLGTRGPRRTLQGVQATSLGFVGAGLCLGLAIASLYVGFDHGAVTVVAPLNATSSLWTVLFAALVFRRGEMIGASLLAAASLIVLGSVLIGASR